MATGRLSWHVSFFIGRRELQAKASLWDQLPSTHTKHRVAATGENIHKLISAINLYILYYILYYLYIDKKSLDFSLDVFFKLPKWSEKPLKDQTAPNKQITA